MAGSAQSPCNSLIAMPREAVPARAAKGGSSSFKLVVIVLFSTGLLGGYLFLETPHVGILLQFTAYFCAVLSQELASGVLAASTTTICSHRPLKQTHALHRSALQHDIQFGGR